MKILGIIKFKIPASYKEINTHCLHELEILPSDWICDKKIRKI